MSPATPSVLSLWAGEQTSDGRSSRKGVLRKSAERDALGQWPEKNTSWAEPLRALGRTGDNLIWCPEETVK